MISVSKLKLDDSVKIDICSLQLLHLQSVFSAKLSKHAESLLHCKARILTITQEYSHRGLKKLFKLKALAGAFLLCPHQMITINDYAGAHVLSLAVFLCLTHLCSYTSIPHFHRKLIIFTMQRFHW